MGVSIDSGGGGKRQLNADLNLVPFIDLLVCCICFLLITAVWTHMARINVNQRGKSSQGVEEDKQEVQVPKLKVQVLLGQEGHIVVAGAQRFVIDKKSAEYDYASLQRRLEEMGKTDQPKDFLRVLVEDGIAYNSIVRTMDVAIAGGFPDIRISDSTAAM